LNPATGEILGKACLAGSEEVTEAVKEANLAQKSWNKIDINERAKIFIRIGDEIPINHNNFSFTRFEPVGVVGIIKPWNYPLLLPFWAIAPALIAGNTVVFKPSDLTPFVGIEVGKICQDAGIPDGVINVVTGDGFTGKSLVSSDIDMISFTGSSDTGKNIMKNSADKLHTGKPTGALTALEIIVRSYFTDNPRATQELAINEDEREYNTAIISSFPRSSVVEGYVMTNRDIGKGEMVNVYLFN